MKLSYSSSSSFSIFIHLGPKNFRKTFSGFFSWSASTGKFDGAAAARAVAFLMARATVSSMATVGAAFNDANDAGGCSGGRDGANDANDAGGDAGGCSGGRNGKNDANDAGGDAGCCSGGRNGAAGAAAVLSATAMVSSTATAGAAFIISHAHS